MSVLHQMAVAAAVRRTRALATAERSPWAYPVIVDLFAGNAHGGLEPHLSVVAPTAARATALAQALGCDAASVTCRVGPKGDGEFAPWIAVHTWSPQRPRVIATGMSLQEDAQNIRTGRIEARQGPCRVLEGVLRHAPEAPTIGLGPGETAFLYTEDPYVARPVSDAFYWPTDEGFLLTAEADGPGYGLWQAQVSCLIGLEEDDDA